MRELTLACTLIVCLLHGNQAKNKWKSLQTQFHKESAAQLKPRSGDAASNTTRQWMFFKQLGFLKGNVYCQSTGNLDDVFDDDYDDEADEEKQMSPPQHLSRSVISESSCTTTATQSTSAEHCAGSSGLECKSVPSQELLLEIEDPSKKSEWLFLLSLLEYFQKITDNRLKMQLRLEIFCLLFNFYTRNSEVTSQPKDEVRVVENLTATNKGVKERQKVQEIKTIKSDTSEENEVEFIDYVPITEEKIKKEVIEIDVKPSKTLKTWLMNPLVIKKELL